MLNKTTSRFPRKFPLRHNVSLGCEMENYIDTIGMYNKTLVVAVIVLLLDFYIFIAENPDLLLQMYILFDENL